MLSLCVCIYIYIYIYTHTHTHMRCVWKIHIFLFKVIPVKSNVLYYPSLPLLEEFFWDTNQLWFWGPLESFYTFKISPLDDPLELGEKKNVMCSKIRQKGSLFLFWQCSTRPRTAVCSKQMRSGHNLSCHNSHLFPCSEQSIRHRNPCRLGDWSSGNMAKTSREQWCYNHRMWLLNQC